MARCWLQARHGTMRWHTSWQGLVSATVTKNFSNGLASQVKGGLVFQSEAEKKTNKINHIGSFKTSLGAYGPLIDGPDYTFLDGRPTSLGLGQMRRAQAQREAAAKVLQLMKETKFAIQREQQLQQEQEETRQEGIQAKLKPKGRKMKLDQEK